jgi:hypothetical protein
LNAGRHIAWFALGFGAITALGLIADPRAVRAQGSGASITTINPPPRAQEVQPRRGGVPAVPAPAADVPLRGTSVPATIPDEPPANGNDSNDGGETADDGMPQDVAGQRRALRDGDINQQEASAPNLDGVIQAGEPRGPQDGVDATANDTRSPEDVAVFDNPPAGFDAALFQAEVEPILDRRPERLFRFEPFDARGIRLGSFVLLPEAEIGSLYNSNVFRSSQARSDIAFDVRPSARLVSNWRQHAVEFRAVGAFSQFNEFTTENDRAYTVEARGRYDLSRRTNVETLVSRDVAQESRSSINASTAAADRANITTDRFAAALNHRFNRLSLQLRGSVAETNYGDVAAIGGGTISNNDRDVRTTEEALRASWEFKPTLFGFVEAGLNQRSYKSASLSDGIQRDSTGERYRVGVSFGNTGQKLRGEVSTGYGRQTPDDARLREISGILFDANLAYRYSALTSFLLTAKSDVTETTLANSAGAFSHQVGVEARHAFHRYLIGTAGLTYTTQDYEGVSLREHEWKSALGLEYYVNREVTLFGKYQHTAFESTDKARNYNADELRVGVRIRQ